MYLINLCYIINYNQFIYKRYYILAGKNYCIIIFLKTGTCISNSLPLKLIMTSACLEPEPAGELCPAPGNAVPDIDEHLLI